MKKLFILFLIAGFAACAETKKEDMSTKSLTEKVDLFLENDQYSDALTLLETQEETEEVMTLREKNASELRTFSGIPRFQRNQHA